MSKTEIRFPLAAARVWALEAHAIVQEHSPQVAIAGSIRRRRDDVGDIDLVVLNFTRENPWQHSAIARSLGGLGYMPIKDGEKIASFTREGAASLDIYYATAETWGITLLVRTGSAAHNIKLAQHASHMTPARRLMVSRGIVDTADNVVASRDELDVFAALKLKYVEPQHREAPEFEHMVGGE